jgi:peptide deformylase
MLSQKSANVPDGFPKLSELIDDMFETMHKADGIGLSAVQIGIPLNIFIAEIHIDSENIHFRKEFINPIITKKFGSIVRITEGCLSLPYISAPVERYETIEIEYYDKVGNKHLETFSGIESRIIQHEMDHLNGILFIDKVHKIWEQTFIEPLKQIKNREIPINYLHK